MSTLHLVAFPAVNPADEAVDAVRVVVTPRYIKWLLSRRKEFERLRKEELSLYCIEYYYPPVTFGNLPDHLGVEPGKWFVEPAGFAGFVDNRYIECITLKVVKEGVMFTGLSKCDTDKGEIQTPEISWEILTDLNAGRKVLPEYIP